MEIGRDGWRSNTGRRREGRVRLRERDSIWKMDGLVERVKGGEVENEGESWRCGRGDG